MNFLKVIESVVGEMEAAGLRHAMIGGFAMAMRGVQRATMDLDFIVMLDDLEKADAILRRHGYERFFHSENVSHYESPDLEWGRIDILHAFRGPTLGMLRRAEKMTVQPGLQLHVVHVEDLIGLKVQALVNNPERAGQDWLDIRLLLRAAAARREPIDWSLLEDYLALFQLAGKLPELKRIHDQADKD